MVALKRQSMELYCELAANPGHPFDYHITDGMGINTKHTCLKAIEDYQNKFHHHLPHKQRPDARLARLRQ
jgi:hypothetical protein